MKKIIGAVVKEFEADEAIKDLDLNNTKELNIAFNSLISFLKE